VFLAAADEIYRTFEFPSNGRLSALNRLTRRISIYFSTSDQVLQFSNVINGMKRLGQDGPHDKLDHNLFPVATYRMVDCSAFQDYAFDPASSHQYYRRSPTVQAAIAQAMGTPV
jgi:esterase/lipase superfamily enzyme